MDDFFKYFLPSLLLSFAFCIFADCMPLFLIAFLPLIFLNLYKFPSKNSYIVLISSFLYFLLKQYANSYILLFVYTVCTAICHVVNDCLYIGKDNYFNQGYVTSEEERTHLFKTLIAPFIITLIFVFCIFFNFHLHAIEYAIMIFFIVFFDFNESFHIFERCIVCVIKTHGIFITHFSKFLDLAKITNFVFSKTGVLTLGNLSVTEIHAEDKKNEKKLIEVLAYAEHFENNRISECIHEYCKNLVKVNEKKIGEYRDFKNGVSVFVGKKRYLVGNYDFMIEHDIEVERCMEVGTILYVAMDQECLGTVTISDQISMKVKKELENIKKLRPVHFTTFSRDNGRITRAVSNTVGISDCYSEVTLKDREYWVQYLKDIYQGPQAYVTDMIIHYPFDIKIGYGVICTDDFDIAIRKENFSLLTLLYEYSLKVSSYKRMWNLLGIVTKFILLFLLLWIRDILIIGSLMIFTIVISLGILIFVTFHYKKGIYRKGVAHEKN